MSGCCQLININWSGFCLHTKKSLHISFSSSLKIAWSLLLEAGSQIVLFVTAIGATVYFIHCIGLEYGSVDLIGELLRSHEPPAHREGQMLKEGAVSELCWQSGLWSPTAFLWSERADSSID